MSEKRSLIVGIHLAGIRQIAVVMHTDCGCCTSWSKADVIADSLKTRLDAESFQEVNSEIGEPFVEKLREYLKAFQDPRKALEDEVRHIRTSSVVPKDVVVYGFLYELATGKVEAIVV